MMTARAMLPLVVLAFLVMVAAAEKKRLHFNADGKFKVVQFTDLHFGSYDDDMHTLAVQGSILNAEKPDLVVITGDLVSGYLWNKKDQGWFANYWRQLIQPMVSRNISWAVALGNHDVEGDLTGPEIMQLDSNHPMSLSQVGPSDIAGSSNYYLPIYLNQSTNEVGQMLWVFDSGHNGCYGVLGWGCVERSQIDWYTNKSNTFQQQYKRVIPSVGFFHIPLYEHLDMWNAYPVYGNLGEDVGVCCSALNTGLYSAMREQADIKHVFCGHDHNNDFYGDYNGITLGYGRKSGYGGYGPPRGWMHGARVLEITQNSFELRTWLRLEDSSIEEQALQQPGSSYRFLGCCDMAGHGREESTPTVFYIYLINSIWFVVVILALWAGRALYRCVQKRKEQIKKLAGAFHSEISYTQCEMNNL